MKSRALFPLLLLYYQAGVTAQTTFRQLYSDVQVGKIISPTLLNTEAYTLQECAERCMSLDPADTCDLAAFNSSSNNCSLGSTNVSLVTDVADVNSRVVAFFKLCGAPPVVPNGMASLSVDGSTSTFTCSPYFAMNGANSVDCVDGVWVGTPPTCVDIDDCASSPCINSGTCQNEVGRYICYCVKGFTGSNCETDINECDSLPCLNGGTCIDGVNLYTCTCAPGYTGVFCETDVNECDSEPCLNGGTCTDGANIYICSCVLGYTGINCETNIDECAILPCLNGGTCTDGINMYMCSCVSGFTGVNCETALSTPIDCCTVLQNNPQAVSGVYQLTMADSTVVSAYCDMDTSCGGWTVIQQRFDGSLNFTETFANYEQGFGSVSAEHWLGLRYIREIAALASTTLRIDVEAANFSTAYEEHTNFYLADAPLYTLSLDLGTGTAAEYSNIVGDLTSFPQGMSYNYGMNFYTIDNDNSYGCALMDYGGWWYDFCTYVNMNGLYTTPGDTYHNEGGVTYRTFTDVQCLKSTKMMISRCNCV